MIMNQKLRKCMLLTHIICSVSWMGSIAAFLLLSLKGLFGANPLVIRASHISMELIAWYVILPLSMASLVSGLIQSLGTKWGLFQHYWIIIKLVINVIATIGLVIHMRPITYLGQYAIKSEIIGPELHKVQIQLIVNAGMALVILLLAAGLAVYKPKGLTPYGWRKQNQK